LIILFFWLLFLGLVPTIVGHNSIYYAIKYVSPTIVAAFPLGEPIIATLLAYLIDIEQCGYDSFFCDVRLQKYSPEKVGITEIWAIINKKNTFNQTHNHPNTYLSAAYYVKAPKDCGDIQFHEPNEVKKFRHPVIEKKNQLNSSGFSIKAEEGNLLVFPSYLYHSVGKNLSSEDRIVISFNVDIITYKDAKY